VVLEDSPSLERVETEHDTAPVVGPTPTGDQVPPPQARLPRLARHSITLSDGQQVGLAVCGRGVPLVLVHGFTAEGMLYAQTLSRLVSMGFKVVAIDTAGHGGTLGLPTGGSSMEAYTRLLSRVVDELGIRRAVFAGHSMGGRLVTELAATEPERAIAVVLIDAIVGDTWDRMVNLYRLWPPLFMLTGAALVADTLSTVPLFGDPRQARKLARLLIPTLAGHVRRPWRLTGPAVSILRSRSSGWMLDGLARHRVPLFVIHGSLDFAVPMATARSAAKRGHGDLVVVEGATHSWLLKDPEALPAVMFELMKGRLGTARLKAILEGGVDPNGATIDDIEGVFFDPGSLVAELTPNGTWEDTEELHVPPRYHWSVARRAG